MNCSFYFLLDGIFNNMNNTLCIKKLNYIPEQIIICPLQLFSQSVRVLIRNYYQEKVERCPCNDLFTLTHSIS
ncbi:hypothetical protein EB796_003879 [Bugula neritina]|uniref:Uncharacterized protein n=1 Tax=Bugula neritina TaxID=10212 RepID=A0A7J7KGL9_BUGNE|nr:hypothetical protein EB796_012832 [Bugula neritina]KAF6037812.1 hypothetical protein EB796_003879 [Bugula neritina]